jgi:hypothetical protein
MEKLLPIDDEEFVEDCRDIFSLTTDTLTKLMMNLESEKANFVNSENLNMVDAEYRNFEPLVLYTFLFIVEKISDETHARIKDDLLTLSIDSEKIDTFIKSALELSEDTKHEIISVLILQDEIYKYDHISHIEHENMCKFLDINGKKIVLPLNKMNIVVHSSEKDDISLSITLNSVGIKRMIKYLEQIYEDSIVKEKEIRRVVDKEYVVIQDKK